MAANAVSPSTLPTIMVSTVLYSCWNRLETKMGSMKMNRLLKMGPFIRSTFWLKKFFFAGMVWVIGFLPLKIYRKNRAAMQLHSSLVSFYLLFTAPGSQSR